MLAIYIMSFLNYFAWYISLQFFYIRETAIGDDRNWWWNFIEMTKKCLLFSFFWSTCAEFKVKFFKLQIIFRQSRIFLRWVITWQTKCPIWKYTGSYDLYLEQEKNDIIVAITAISSISLMIWSAVSCEKMKKESS